MHALSSPEDKAKVRSRIADSIDKLPDRLRKWTLEHLIDPINIKAFETIDGDMLSEVVQVTGDVGHEDAGYWVFFDPSLDQFGLFCPIENGRVWKMGIYGELDDTISNI